MRPARRLGRECAGGVDPAFATATDETIAEVENVQQDSQQGPCHLAFSTSEAVVVGDLGSSTNWPELRDSALRSGLMSVAGIPMTFAERAVGSLDIYDGHVRAWTEHDLTTARVLADTPPAISCTLPSSDRARRVNEQLEAALRGRVLIEQAKGLLAGERGISLDEAFAVLRHHARSRNASLHSIAQAVVGLGLRPEPARRPACISSPRLDWLTVTHCRACTSS